MEFTNAYGPDYGTKTRYRAMNDTDPLQNSNFYHPYAFVGIKGLPPGKGFESLRSNWGLHMSVGTYAPAELRVRLRFNRLIGMYSFDYHQYMTEYHFQDSFKNVNQAKDRSLSSSYQSLMMANLTVYRDYGVSIFLQGNSRVYFTNATGNFTKADSVFLPSGEFPQRYDYLGRLNTGSNLIWNNNKTYFSWVDNYVYSDDVKECPPPYTDYSNEHCFNYTLAGASPPEIFKCYTGLVPYYCPTLAQTIENAFVGYL